MILNKDTILEEVKFPKGLDVFQVNSHSIDLRVADTMMLKAGYHFIARTYDVVELPNNIMAIVYPRSSLNRLHVTLDPTGVVDPGYMGTLILPLTAHSDVVIPAGTRIASLIFYRTEAVLDVRQSKYHGSDGTYKPDKIEETTLLGTADGIEALKAKFKI